jgi:hypothetical protein
MFLLLSLTPPEKSSVSGQEAVTFPVPEEAKYVFLLSLTT